MGMFPQQDLTTARLRLRQLRLSDVPDLIAACEDPLTRRFLPHLEYPFSADAARNWIEVRAPARWGFGEADFCIADRATDRMLGHIVLHSVHWPTQVAAVGYFTAPWARGQGVATEALRTITEWAFQHGMARLEVTTEHANIASQRVAYAAGYQREGIRRGGGWLPDGGRWDQVVWGRLATDSGTPSPRLLPDLPGGALSDGVVTLRPLGPDDTENMYTLLSLPEVVHSWIPPRPLSREEVQRRCLLAPGHWLAGERAMFTIRDAATDAFAGDLVLDLWNMLPGEGLVGYSLLPQWRGRGFATRALRLLAHWAFSTLRLARLTAGTRPDNHKSQQVLKRVGFVHEGVERQRVPAAEGGRVDNVRFALLAEDWWSAFQTIS